MLMYIFGIITMSLLIIIWTVNIIYIIRYNLWIRTFKSVNPSLKSETKLKDLKGTYAYKKIGVRFNIAHADYFHLNIFMYSVVLCFSTRTK